MITKLLIDNHRAVATSKNYYFDVLSPAALAKKGIADFQVLCLYFISFLKEQRL